MCSRCSGTSPSSSPGLRSSHLPDPLRPRHRIIRGPALLGLPVGIQVFTSSIYQAVHRYPSQIGLASTYAFTLLLITTVGIYFISKLSSSGSKYSTMTGKGFGPRQIDLGRWRWVAAAVSSSISC
jgi:ABC-type Fe3+ transport system permease subunit